MTISDKSRKTIQAILDMEEENKILKEKVRKLESKYVWGLQPIDYALAKYGDSKNLSELEKDEYYTKEQMTDEMLHNNLIVLMRSDNVQIFGWSEVISDMMFSDEIDKLLLTLAKRDGE